MNPTIDLSLRGPTEDDWLELCSYMPPFDWPTCSRVVVVSPHPDDETFGAGGLVATAARRGWPVMLIAVTDGEAADPSVDDLAEIRSAESMNAIRRLAPAGAIERAALALPDGDLARRVDDLQRLIAGRLRHGDFVLCPLPDDGHPDHTATSMAATAAAGQVGVAALRWFPIWAWHCHDPARSPLRAAARLDLDTEAVRRKRAAIDCYPSQTTGADPVVPPAMLERLSRDFEVFVDPSTGIDTEAAS